MQAILTYFIPASNTRGTRIKAICDRGSITIPIPYPDRAGEDVHIKAADVLVAKFLLEDEKKYGKGTNPWSRPRVCGGLHNGATAHVFLS